MTTTQLIHDAIRSIGGREVKVRELPEVGMAAVRYKNSAGLYETRFGFSLKDLGDRIERYVKRCKKKKARGNEQT